MRKIKNYSVRFVPQQHVPKPKPNNQNKLTKDRQEFLNKIAASGFKKL